MKPTLCRALAQKLGISLGKLNDCLNALINEEWIEVEDSRCGKNKITRRYRLTPPGLRGRAHGVIPCFSSVVFTRYGKNE